MNEPVINEKILLNFDSHHEWYINQTIIEVAARAKQYMQQYNRLMGSFQQHQSPPYLQNTEKPVGNGCNGGGNGKGNGAGNGNNPNPKPKPVPYQHPTIPPPPAAPAPAPAPTRQPVDATEVNNIMSILQNGDKATYLAQLRQQSPSKFYSMETKNACSKVGAYSTWQQIASRTQPAPTTPAPSPPLTPAAARRAQINEQHNQAQQMMETMIGTQGLQLLSELSDVKEEDETEVNSNNHNSNTPVDPYYYYSSNLPKSLLRTKDQLLSTLRKKLQEKRQRNLTTLTSRRPLQTTTPQQAVTIIAHCNTATIPTTATRLPLLSNSHRVIADSGATHFMTGIPSLFGDITYYSATHTSKKPHVMLGDDTTYHPVEGYGWVNYLLKGKRIRHHALFIPALGKTSLLSV
jgi:hypothetical protein